MPEEPRQSAKERHTGDQQRKKKKKRTSEGEKLWSEKGEKQTSHA